MGKKRRQAVGHPAEVKLTPEEFTSHCFEALLAAEDRIERLYKCSARWKAAAKGWRVMAIATNPASMPWRGFRKLLEKKEKADD